MSPTKETEKNSIKWVLHLSIWCAPLIQRSWLFYAPKMNNPVSSSLNKELHPVHSYLFYSIAQGRIYSFFLYWFHICFATNLRIWINIINVNCRVIKPIKPAIVHFLGFAIFTSPLPWYLSPDVGAPVAWVITVTKVGWMWLPETPDIIPFTLLSSRLIRLQLYSKSSMINIMLFVFECIVSLR